MHAEHQEDQVLARLKQWGEDQPLVRAILLTSTRANPYATVDILSDYDVVLVVSDIHPFYENRSWLQDFGQVLVTYWDSIHSAPDYGHEQFSNVIQYEDGLKIDFTLWPVTLLRQIAAAPTLPDELDNGYIVLLDKEQLTVGMQAPTYTAFVPALPKEEAFQTFVEEFFSDVPYVAKCLWRDELLPAKWCLDYDMKHVYLRRLLEWRVHLGHNGPVKIGALGKGLKKYLPPDIWSQLEDAYTGAGIEENWDSLFKTIAIFRRVAVEVAGHLGFEYPHDLDRRVNLYVQKVRGLARRHVG